MAQDGIGETNFIPDEVFVDSLLPLISSSADRGTVRAVCRRWCEFMRLPPIKISSQRVRNTNFLVEMLSKADSVRTDSLSFEANGSAIRSFLFAFMKSSRVKQLILTSESMDLASRAVELAPILRNYPSLTHLRFEKCSFDENFGTVITEPLKRNSTLVTLELVQPKNLLPSYFPFTSLHRLTRFSAVFEGCGNERLDKALGEIALLSGLQSLEIGSIVENASMKLLLSHLQRRTKKLDTLQLHVHYADEDIAALINPFLRLPETLNFGLFANRMTATALDMLAECLQMNTTLCTLSLKDSAFDDHKIKLDSLVKMLHRNTSLCSLTITGTKGDPKPMEAASATLSQIPPFLVNYDASDIPFVQLRRAPRNPPLRQ